MFLYQTAAFTTHRKIYIIIKKHEKEADNPPIRIHVNKIENRITFKIKTGYYFEL